MTRQAKEKVVAFIPVRGGSKSIPLKNIKPIAGRPLLQWVVEAAAGADCVDVVYIATDSEKIVTVARKINNPKVRVIGRSAETVTDTASTESALLEFCKAHNFEHVFLIQATSPLLRSEDLQGCWQMYSESICDSMLSVVRQKRFLWEVNERGAIPINYDPMSRPRRQEFPGYLVENGAFYLSSREQVLASNCRISGQVSVYEMREESYYELDEPSDWEIIERLLQRSRNNHQYMNKIRMLIMDCDGVMTDAGMYYSEEGEAFKKFNTRDGKAIELLRKAGIKTAIVTGEKSLFSKLRAEKLQIDYIVLGAVEKDQELLKLAEQSGIQPEEMAYIGDDINDLPAFGLCALSACPADAVRSVREQADWVLRTKGGFGAIREMVDRLLCR